MDDDRVDEIPRWRIYILRKAIGEAETVLGTTGTPSAFGFRDLDAPDLREILSRPIHLDTRAHIYEESCLHLLDFSGWVFFLHFSSSSILHFLYMLLYPHAFSQYKALDRPKRHPERWSGDECAFSRYLERECATTGTDERIGKGSHGSILEWFLDLWEDDLSLCELWGDLCRDKR